MEKKFNIVCVVKCARGLLFKYGVLTEDGGYLTPVFIILLSSLSKYVIIEHFLNKLIDSVIFKVNKR